MLLGRDPWRALHFFTGAKNQGLLLLLLLLRLLGGLLRRCNHGSPTLLQLLLQPLLGLRRFYVLIQVALHGAHVEFATLAAPEPHAGGHFCKVAHAAHAAHAAHVAHLFQHVGHVVHARHFLHFFHEVAGFLHDFALFNLARLQLGIQLFAHRLHDAHQLARVLEQVLEHGLHGRFVRRVQVHFGRGLLRNFLGQAADFAAEQAVQMLVHGIRIKRAVGGAIRACSVRTISVRTISACSVRASL